MGAELAGRGIGLVYGGGAVGLMGVVADAVLDAGGSVTGVIPTGLFSREVAHDRVTELHHTATMHERKALMYDLADAFVAMPGGVGTLDELFETLTWAQLGLHDKPVGLLDVDGFFGDLLAFLRRTEDDGFVKHRHLARLRVAAEHERPCGIRASVPSARRGAVNRVAGRELVPVTFSQLLRAKRASRGRST